LPTTTLRPNSTVARARAGNPSTAVFPGGTTAGDDAAAWAALQDESDASYHYGAEALVESTYPSGYRYGFDDVALPAGARILYLQGRQRIAMANPAGNQRIGVWWMDSSTLAVHWSEEFTTTRDSVHRTVAGSQRSRDASGNDWTAATVNRVIEQFQMYALDGNGGDTWLYESYLDVVYRRQGSVTGLTPVGGSTAVTSRPTIGWTPQAPDNTGNPQYSYLVRLFTAAQVASGGFNPWTTPPVWTTGEVVNASARSVQVGVDIANGNYVAYVWVAQPWSGTTGRWWSPDASTAFAVVAIVPASPEVRAWGESGAARNAIEVSGISGAAELVVVEAFDGQEWVQVRSAVDAAVTGAIMVFHDYERPPWVITRYRAYAIDTAGGVRAASAPSAEAVAEWQSNDWWLKDPLDPSRNRIVGVSSFPFAERRPQTRLDLLGNDKPAVIHDGSKGFEGQCSMWALDQETFDALLAMVRDSDTLLIQRNLGDQFYIARGDSVNIEQLRAVPLADEPYSVRHAHSLSFSWTEVAPP
jgi:hypothetical protein